jgi:predicted nuclease of predicted toxin-antitoxin system
MKLLIDMNLSPRWTDFFASSHIEAIHWSVIGKADAPDIEIMEYAKANDYAVFTNDLDFGAILAATHADKPSVVQIRMGDVIPDSTAAPIVSALLYLAADIEKGALVTIDPRKARVTMLPLY